MPISARHFARVHLTFHQINPIRFPHSIIYHDPRRLEYHRRGSWFLGKLFCQQLCGNAAHYRVSVPNGAQFHRYFHRLEHFSGAAAQLSLQRYHHPFPREAGYCDGVLPRKSAGDGLYPLLRQKFYTIFVFRADDGGASMQAAYDVFGTKALFEQQNAIFGIDSFNFSAFAQHKLLFSALPVAEAVSRKNKALPAAFKAVFQKFHISSVRRR